MDGNEEYETDSYLECLKSPETMRAYVETVAETGDDYLGVFSVTEKRTQTWTAVLANWIGNSSKGMLIVSGRRKGRKSVLPLQFPAAVGEFLEMDKSNALFTTRAVHSIEELHRLQQAGDFQILRNKGTHARIRFTLDVPVSKPQFKRAVIQTARKQLQEMNKEGKRK
jgi:hypothetical protein